MYAVEKNRQVTQDEFTFDNIWLLPPLMSIPITFRIFIKWVWYTERYVPYKFSAEDQGLLTFKAQW
jgi:hypothetical protein